MLGLSLAIRVGKKVLGNAIDALFSVLKKRVTYFENSSASKATVKAIDKADVLDKATILLTPTAYSDARVHSVKTYTGDEYITNGDFSDGETGWTITGAAASATQSVVNGALVMYSGTPSDSNNALSRTDTPQGYNGHIYKLEINASDFTVSPNGYLRLDGIYDSSNIIAFSASISTVYFTAYRDFTHIRFFAGGANQGYTIDNVSILDVSSDFDFDRASSATRINSDGLVQDMQSITDPELVLNGDYEDLGSELVTNGTFDADSNWTKGAGTTIENGFLNFTSASSNTDQSLTTTNGKTYKVIYTVSNYSAGSVRFRFTGVANVNGTSRSANGTYTEYITATSNNSVFRFAASTFTGSIDNVSVKQVDPNDRWTLGTGTTIESGFLNFTSASSNTDQSLTTTNGKTYKVIYTVSNYSAGSVRFRFTGVANVNGTSRSANGTYTEYITATSNNSVFRFAASTFTGSIDNVSVKQVDPNDRWTLGTGWSIEDGVATSTTSGSSSYLTQSGILTSSNTYKITFTVSNYVSGTVKATVSGQEGDSITANGTYTEILTTTGTDFSIKSQGGTFNGSIDNVSVKDVTFSTDVDLARINYDGNGANGHWLLEPTSTNIIPYSEDFSEWALDDVTVVNNATTSPNGDTSASLIIGNTNASRHNVVKTGLSNTVTASYSLFAKAKELRYLQIASVNSTNQIANFDLLNGTIGTVGAGFSDVVLEEYPNDWYKISLVSLNKYNSFYISLVSSTTASWLESWTMSNSTDGLYIWGAQLEELSFATSYIPTLTGSTVTRATETLLGSGNSTLINSTEGVLYAEIAALETTHSVSNFISISDGTYNNRASILFSSGATNQIRFFLRDGGATQIDTNQSVTDVKSFNKVAFKFKVNDFAVWINGVEASTDTSGSVWSSGTINQLAFSEIGTSAGLFRGKCKALAVFNEALSDTQLQNLTS